MIEGYNSYYKVNQKLDISTIDKMLDLNVNLMRYVHQLRYRNLMIDADANYKALLNFTADCAGSANDWQNLKIWW